MANILVSGLDRDILSGWGGIVYVLTEKGLTAKLIETKMIWVIFIPLLMNMNVMCLNYY